MRISKRPEITNELVNFIRQTIEANPEKGRSQLSVMLCEEWGWKDSNGRTKDMSCRDMLAALDKSGKITLPPRITKGRSPGDSKGVKHLVHDKTPINVSLKEIQPLQVKEVTDKETMNQFKSFIDQYHYLGFSRCVGESMPYIVYSKNGQPISCLLFGAPAWSCRDRDTFIGWSKDERKSNLISMANNSRYLIMPWVRVPHLASHILAIISKRVSADWERKYGHSIYLLETFVEIDRFKGTCYKAANWQNAGRTTGRGRNGGHHNSIVPQKAIYLYPLSKDWKSALCKGTAGEKVCN